MDSIKRVNPEGVTMRRLSIQTAKRRQYSVPAPNHLWHIDGNHKLIRSVFTITPCIVMHVLNCKQRRSLEVVNVILNVV